MADRIFRAVAGYTSSYLKDPRKAGASMKPIIDPVGGHAADLCSMGAV